MLIDANRVVPVGRLLDALWGDEPPATAHGTLHTHVSRLRSRLSALGPGVALSTREPGYVLRLDPDELDAVCFERLVASARTFSDRDDALRTYDEALKLWRGPAYAGFGDEEFARPAAVRLEELRLIAAEERVDTLLELGRHAEVQGDLEQLVASQPLRERLHAQLMIARYRSGRTAEALETHRRYRERLAGELGLDPSAQLQHLEQAILVQAPDLAAVPQPTPLVPPIVSGRKGSPAADIPRAADAPRPGADTAHAAATALGAAEPERKLVTILLAEIDVPLPADGDPEEALAALEPAVAAMQAAVHRYDGTVHRVSSHSISALFGAPLAQEDPSRPGLLRGPGPDRRRAKPRRPAGAGRRALR